MSERLKKIFKISFIIFLVGIIFVNSSSCFAAINPDNFNEGNSNENEVSTGLQSIIALILGVPAGVLSTALSAVVNAITLGLFIIMYLAFLPLAGEGSLAFPFPDQIVFNRLAFFDPNFINPTSVSTAPINMLQDIIKGFYYTGFIIAGAIFIISAMLIGIKLALSSIAEEKAHYKQALTSWVSGIAMLFLAHLLMYGIFYINETIVHSVYNVTKDIQFYVNLTDAIPFVGKSISTILGGIEAIFTGEVPEVNALTFSVHGYGGMLLNFLVKAAGGNLIYSIISGIILGQTCALIFMYIKRLFYCVLLGIMAPLIIAADILKKSVGNNGSKLFDNWFKNFSLTVFLQSFQAIFMTFIMLMLQKVAIETVKITYAEEVSINGTLEAMKSFAGIGNKDIILGILALVSIMALVKLEKVIKQMFGIEDGMIGDLKTSGAKAIGAITMGKKMASNVTEPFKRASSARTRMNQAADAVGIPISERGKYQNAPSEMVSNINNDTTNTSMASASATASDAINKDTAGTQIVEEQVKNSDRIEKAGVRELLQMIAKNTDETKNNIDKIQTNNKEQTQKEKYDQYNAAVTELQAARRDRKYSIASAIAGMSVGMGMTDEMSEAITAGGLISSPVDKAIQYSVNRDQRKIEDRELGKNTVREEDKNRKTVTDNVIDQGFKRLEKVMLKPNRMHGGTKEKSKVIEKTREIQKFVESPKTTVRQKIENKKGSRPTNIGDI